MEIWQLILIAVAVVFLVNFLLKKVAFVIRALLIIAIILILYYFLKDPVVALLVG